MDNNLQSLIAYSRERQRVCPQPKFWQRLWEMLPDRRQIDGRWLPAPPLILAAWHDASDGEKKQRLSARRTDKTQSAVGMFD
jgi:hypothetical protein